MMITGPLPEWIQKLAVEYFALDVKNLFTKTTTFTPIFRLLLVMNGYQVPSSVNAALSCDLRQK